jgi:hypothetical protein
VRTLLVSSKSSSTRATRPARAVTVTRAKPSSWRGRWCARSSATAASRAGSPSSPRSSSWRSDSRCSDGRLPMRRRSPLPRRARRLLRRSSRATRTRSSTVRTPSTATATMRARSATTRVCRVPDSTAALSSSTWATRISSRAASAGRFSRTSARAGCCRATPMSPRTSPTPARARRRQRPTFPLWQRVVFAPAFTLAGCRARSGVGARSGGAAWALVAVAGSWSSAVHAMLGVGLVGCARGGGCCVLRFDCGASTYAATAS